MTDDELIKLIIKRVKLFTWTEIEALGINIQQAQKIRKGQPVRFYAPTLARLRKKLKIDSVVDIVRRA